MNKKHRLALAATVTAAMLTHAPTSFAATESARTFLTEFTSHLSLGENEVAHQRLARLSEVCPGFDGLLLANGNVITAQSLNNIFVALDNHAVDPNDIVSALRNVLEASLTISYLCNDIDVGPVELATASSFPVGSAG